MAKFLLFFGRFPVPLKRSPPLVARYKGSEFCLAKAWEAIRGNSCLAFLAWGDFHARSRFARSTILEEKWGTTRSLKKFGKRRFGKVAQGIV